MQTFYDRAKIPKFLEWWMVFLTGLVQWLSPASFMRLSTKPCTRNDAVPLLCVARVLQPPWEGSCLHVAVCGLGDVQNSLPQSQACSWTQAAFVKMVHWLIRPQQSTWIKVPFSMHWIMRDWGCLGSLVICLSYHFTARVKHAFAENRYTKGHFGNIMLTVIWALFSSEQLKNEVISSANSGMK